MPSVRVLYKSALYSSQWGPLHRGLRNCLQTSIQSSQYGRDGNWQPTLSAQLDAGMSCSPVFSSLGLYGLLRSSLHNLLPTSPQRRQVAAQPARRKSRRDLIPVLEWPWHLYIQLLD